MKCLDTIYIEYGEEFMVKEISSSEALLWLWGKYVGRSGEPVCLEWMQEWKGRSNEVQG